MFDLNGQTVGFDTQNNALVIIDQTKLPNEEVIRNLKTKEEIYDAIKTLKLRGAPCIGVSAAVAMAVLSNDSRACGEEAFINEFEQNADYLVSSRPTAVNLSWAVNEMKKVLFNCKGQSLDSIKKALNIRATEILEDDIATCRAIGGYGAEILKDTDAIITHCNAGRLACVKYGTALSPVYVAKEQGHNIKVYADETRPLLQGARLTAYELTKEGIDTTVVCDSMSSYVMKNGLVGAVLTGADRIARNGDTANKIGTSSLAIVAKHYGIPFYVCAPASTFDRSAENGDSIVIEMRDEAEISELWYEKRMTPESAKALNPAFDITDSSLITAFITEKGIFTPDCIGKMLSE